MPSVRTPGPWRAAYEREWGWCVRSDGLQVTRVSGDKQPVFIAFKLRSKEDAFILAAAPTLLETLEKMRMKIDALRELAIATTGFRYDVTTLGEILAFIDAAIAKAGG